MVAKSGGAVTRLGSSFDLVQDSYEIVVVGSGYGGAIAASRLARAGRQVCVLEKGKEFQPGEYPDTWLEAGAELQMSMPEFNVHLGPRTGLYELYAGRDINVFKGCGLGGTSLVNANVSIRPDPRVFSQYQWPAIITSEAAQANSPLWQACDRAAAMLGANPYPTVPCDLGKLTGLEASANAMGAAQSFRRTTINVTFESKVSSGGVQQFGCTRCGDCVTGCNYGAKNTTLMNYLPDAVRHGAVIFTKCAVRFLERSDGKWIVWYQRLDSGHEPFDATPRKVTADLVVLGAGSLGSTEILLRSKQRGLALSDSVGHGFSGNGDVLGFGYDLNPEINGMGWGGLPPGRLPSVGPCITGVIDLRSQAARLIEGMIIEEGSVPGAVAPFMPEIMAALERISGKPLGGQASRVLDELESIALGPHHGALQHTQIYLVMAHDGGDGVMSLDSNDQLQISWPNVGRKSVFQNIDQKLQSTTTPPVGGVFVENPLWAVDLLGKNLTTVHPLGGCRMADSAADGVVDPDGRVFTGASPNSAYDSLYVIDGAIVPCPVGVNPLLTISALAERCVANLVAARGWQINYESEPALPVTAARLGADFAERWAGTCKDGSQLAVAMTVIARDLDALLSDTSYRAEVRGSAVVSRGSGAEIFSLAGGIGTAPGEVSYELDLVSNGAVRHLSGKRVVADSKGPDLFARTTSLELRDTVEDALSCTAHCEPDALLQELGGIRIYNAANEQDRLQRTDSLSRRLFGPLAELYGKLPLPRSVFAAGAPLRKRRPLRAPAPEVDYFQSRDNALLRLVRYRGYGRPPVLLVHGLGQSSRLFFAGSLQPNLVEFLHRFGLDVWLLDNRGSIDLPGSLNAFNLDQVAAVDLPEAIARIRQETAANRVAIVGHGWGAACAWMFLLGPDSVGAGPFVSSQMGPLIDVPRGSALAARLRTASVLRRLGVTMSGGYEPHPATAGRLWHAALALGGASEAAALRRVQNVYGRVFLESNLTQRTKAAISDLYGPVSLAAFEQGQTIVRAGRLLNDEGEDAYLSNPQLPNVPILMLHGSANSVFLASGMERSMQWLRGKGLADHVQGAVISGFGHDDTFLGHLAPSSVFPRIAEHLRAYRDGAAPPA